MQSNNSHYEEHYVNKMSFNDNKLSCSHNISVFNICSASRLI